ncbi:hypothetical protein MGG_16553 [Paecilomyces variotii No. 5]|uniref:Uncharacterized protein n=1 Tax=Byssochlamys spectabilis (strain No. 5 / NBRC 109023) TaxID=1356009 RepID=V5FWU2_BYSSN|nr:hypothetical protein MGG_16553 [Paecilomyces variotii No. 5]
MQLQSILSVALLSLGSLSTASAYVVTLWQNPDCTGDSRTDNVWDNTCSTPAPGFSAVTPVTYGGSGQQAQFYDTNNCAGSYPLGKGTYGADGSDSDFQIGKCIGFLRVANAAGSWA